MAQAEITNGLIARPTVATKIGKMECARLTTRQVFHLYKFLLTKIFKDAKLLKTFFRARNVLNWMAPLENGCKAAAKYPPVIFA